MSPLAPGTRQSYISGVKCYIGFCRLFHILSPFPLSQAILSRFVVHMADKAMSYVTIRVYLSGLRFMQIASGLPDPAQSSFCNLEYVLLGIRKSSSYCRRPQRLPVTPHILSRLFHAWSQPPVFQDRVMCGLHAVRDSLVSFGLGSLHVRHCIHSPSQCYRYLTSMWTPGLILHLYPSTCTKVRLMFLAMVLWFTLVGLMGRFAQSRHCYGILLSRARVQVLYFSFRIGLPSRAQHWLVL